MVDDNFNYMDEDERHEQGTYDTVEEALAVLAKIQDRRATAKLPDPRLSEAEAVINFHQWNFRPAVDNLRKLKVLSPAGNRMMALSLFELQDYPGALKYFQKIPNVSANRVEQTEACRSGPIRAVPGQVSGCGRRPVLPGRLLPSAAPEGKADSQA